MKIPFELYSSSNNSLYRQLENNMSEALKQMVQNTILSSEFAKVILQAVPLDNAEFGCVGKRCYYAIEANEVCITRNFKT